MSFSRSRLVRTAVCAILLSTPMAIKVPAGLPVLTAGTGCRDKYQTLQRHGPSLLHELPLIPESQDMRRKMILARKDSDIWIVGHSLRMTSFIHNLAGKLTFHGCCRALLLLQYLPRSQLSSAFLFLS